MDIKTILWTIAKRADWDGPTVHELLVEYVESLNDPDRFRAFLEAKEQEEA